MYEHILSEHKIGGITIKNRFVMPGMGANYYGMINEEDIAWYEERAKGGFGLIITEFNAVEPAGKGLFSEIVSCDEIIPDYQKLADRIHQYGSKIFVQLHHAGRQCNIEDGTQTSVGASAIPCPRKRSVVKELSTQDVWDIIEKFGDAALRAKKGGMDGVEIHGGHGYLVDQFMSAHTNIRTDEFGGDLSCRMRFPLEILNNIKKKCGSDFPVSMRISFENKDMGGRKLNETIMVCKQMEKAGLDVLNISSGSYSQWDYIMSPYFEPVGVNADPAKAIKAAVNIPVMCVGRMNDPLAIDSYIENGYFDFALLGRVSIADAHFPNKVKEGRTDEICPCVGCLTSCQGMTGSLGTPGATMCAMNPFSHNETRMGLYPAENPRNIVVIGGGPAGLNVAWVAAARGHKVTLFEKLDRVGGQMLYAMVPPGKSELARAVKYFHTMCKKYGVEIITGVEADKDVILSRKPEAVVLATGAVPIEAKFPADNMKPVRAIDILSGHVIAGDNCLVIGGGLVGIETAEFLVSQNRKAAVVEMQSTVGGAQNETIHHYTERYLKDNDIKIMTETVVEKLTNDGAVCKIKDREITLSGYDMIISALGTKPYNPLEAELKELVEVHVIGDSFGGPNQNSIRAAVDGGVFKALQL